MYSLGIGYIMGVNKLAAVCLRLLSLDQLGSYQIGALIQILWYIILL